MVEVTAIGLVVVGLVLLFAGAALSVYGVGLLGATLGGSGGYLIAPTLSGLFGIGELVTTILIVGIGVIVGALITYALLSVALAGTGLIAGTYIGGLVAAPVLVGGPWYIEWGVAIAIGVGTAIAALILTKTTLVITTAAVGAALASRSLTLTALQTARTELTVEPLLFDIAALPFVALFVLGVLSQLGLFKFGYVTRIATALPGARVFRDKQRS